MKKLLLHTLLMVGLCAPVVSQTFNNRYKFDPYLYGNGFSVEEHNDSLFIFSTCTDTLKKMGLHILDQMGEVLGENQIGYDSMWHWVGHSNTTQKYDSGFVSAGSYQTFAQPVFKGIIVKWNFEGDTVATARFHSSQLDSMIILRQAIAVEDGFVAIGTTRDGPGDSNILLLKTDFALNEIWRRTFSNSGTPLEGYSLCSIENGGFLIGGMRTASTLDHVLIKTNAMGLEQVRRYYGNQFDAYYAVVESTENGLYFGGRRQIGENDDYSQICKLDNQLDTIWCKVYGNSGPECWIESMKVIEGGDIVACGIDHSDPDMVGFILRINPDGELIWYRKYAQTPGNWCYFKDVIQTNDGGFFLTGSLFAEVDMTQDIWGIKLNSEGCLLPDCADGIDEAQPPRFMSIGPNPVRSDLNIYVRQAPDAGTITVCDMTGKVVLEFVATPGVTYNIPIDSWSSGMYLIHFSIADQVLQSEKVIKAP